MLFTGVRGAGRSASAPVAAVEIGWQGEKKGAGEMQPREREKKMEEPVRNNGQQHRLIPNGIVSAPEFGASSSSRAVGGQGGEQVHQLRQSKVGGKERNEERGNGEGNKRKRIRTKILPKERDQREEPVRKRRRSTGHRSACPLTGAHWDWPDTRIKTRHIRPKVGGIDGDNAVQCMICLVELRVGKEFHDTVSQCPECKKLVHTKCFRDHLRSSTLLHPKCPSCNFPVIGWQCDHDGYDYDNDAWTPDSDIEENIIDEADSDYEPE